MYCTKCGAKVLEKDKFCAQCGMKISSSDQESTAAEQVLNDTSDLTKGFLTSVMDRIGSGMLHDRFGKPLEPLTPDEEVAIASFVLRLVAQGETKSGFRCYLELGQDSRKTVVALIGLLPLIGADAEARGMQVIYVTPDTGSLSGARNDFRAYTILTQDVNFTTWNDLESHLRSGGAVDKFWIIGDLDWGAGTSPHTDIQQAIRKAVSTVASNSRSSAVFLHQIGHDAAVALPLTIKN